MNSISSFGDYIRQRRKALDITQAELAERVGCSGATIQKIESGERRPSRQVAQLLAHVLRIPDEEQTTFIAVARDLNRGDHPTSPITPSPDYSATMTEAGIPRPPSSLIGRKDVLNQILAALRHRGARLVTLVGPPGIGKTRMAIEVAMRAFHREHYGDGVKFVSLATITRASAALLAIARALGIREVPGRSLIETVTDYLRSKHLLLVLDNFEQVLEAAPLLAEVSELAPRLKILTTSRIRLQIIGEHVVQIPPMHLPDLDDSALSPGEIRQYEAIHLFVERATAVRSSFSLTRENAHAVSELCRRLDGLPLAIELAAARVNVLPPQVILSRLHDRFKLLKGGPIDSPSRHQSLREALEWSYTLLGEPERELFRQLGLFVGGSTLEGIEAVCYTGAGKGSDILDCVSSLVDNNLLVMQESSDDPEPRYTMLESIHEYALERLQEPGIVEAEEVRLRHARYFVQFAKQVEPLMSGAQAGEAHGCLQREHDNIRAVLTWCKQSATQESALLGLRLVAAVWPFWEARSYYSEARRQLDEMLALCDELFGSIDPQRRPDMNLDRAKALWGVGALAHYQGDPALAQAGLQQSIDLYRKLGEEQPIASLLNNLGNVFSTLSDYEMAAEMYKESITLRRNAGERQGMLSGLNNLGLVAFEQGNYAYARSLYEEAVSIAREFGVKREEAIILDNLGEVAFTEGDYEYARRLHEESLAVHTELQDKQGMALDLHHLGMVASETGDCSQARSVYAKSLTLAREISFKRGMIAVLNSMGQLEMREGKAPEAATYYRESMLTAKEIGDKRSIALALSGLGTIAGARALPKRAATLFGASHALAQALGTTLYTNEPARETYNSTLVAAQVQLDTQEWAKAWEMGSSMGLDDVTTYALGEAV